MHRKTVAIVVNKTESGFSLYPSVALPVPADSEPPMLLLSPLPVLSSLPGVLCVPTMLQREQSRLKALPKNSISLPTRVGTRDGTSFGGLLTRDLCARRGSGRRCSRAARAQDKGGGWEEEDLCFSVRNPSAQIGALYSHAPPVRGDEPGQGGWGLADAR
jgi:hypothetical protein